MLDLNRRRFLQGATALAAVSAIPGQASAAAPIDLRIVNRSIEVAGKPAKVFGLIGPDGKPGLNFHAGESFRVRLINETAEKALIHWHGLTPPNNQDGVPDVTQPRLDPGASFTYDFPLKLAGTNWMHSHHSLQAQRLMSAPLIIRDRAEAPLGEQEVVVMLSDFTFRDPAEILSSLQHGMMGHMDHGAAKPQMDMSGMDMSGMDMGQMNAGQMDMGGGHLNDIDFDAYLANDRTLDDPEIVPVEPGGRLRLRLINASGSTNFMIDLGELIGELIAVDGRPIVPLRARQFPLAMAQRADIRLLPKGAGAWPILFQREGALERSGIVLATQGAAVKRLAAVAAEPAPEMWRLPGRILQPLSPLPPRPADRRISVELAGDMMRYSWSLPQSGGPRQSDFIEARRGERIEIEMINRSDMSHPMHLHGHHFQVVALDGRAVAGAVRDTELVQVNGRVTIAFDADNPGRWMFHCHNLYHMLSGMMTEVRYT